jgi:hypothetical protein
MRELNVSAPGAKQGRGSDERKAEVSIHGLVYLVKEHTPCQRRFFLPRRGDTRSSAGTMRRVNLVKACSIVGFVLAEIYMLFVVLAPNAPGKSSRMFIPEVFIPKEHDVAPGTPPPLGAQVKRVLVAGFFFGPFGALAGLGVGLLLEGLRQSLGSGPKPPAPPQAR